jgi:uncharacterized protein (TIGR03437 family)
VPDATEQYYRKGHNRVGYASSDAATQLPVAVFINLQSAAIAFYGEAPGIVSGVMQLNVQIPLNVPTGSLPIQVVVGGNASQNGVTVSAK